MTTSRWRSPPTTRAPRRSIAGMACLRIAKPAYTWCGSSATSTPRSGTQPRLHAPHSHRRAAWPRQIPRSLRCREQSLLEEQTLDIVAVGNDCSRGADALHPRAHRVQLGGLWAAVAAVGLAEIRHCHSLDLRWLYAPRCSLGRLSQARQAGLSL